MEIKNISYPIIEIIPPVEAEAVELLRGRSILLKSFLLEAIQNQTLLRLPPPKLNKSGGCYQLVFYTINKPWKLLVANRIKLLGMNVNNAFPLNTQRVRNDRVGLERR